MENNKLFLHNFHKGTQQQPLDPSCKMQITFDYVKSAAQFIINLSLICMYLGWSYNLFMFKIFFLFTLYNLLRKWLIKFLFV